MNLIEVERLVRKISEVLQHRAHEAEARQLAQDYADLCQTARHRLEQCAAMLGEGDAPQALQLADAPPPLLDLVTRLGFRQLNEWRAYCQSHDLPVADSLDGKFIRQLGETYGKGCAPNHELYRNYREAVLGRDDYQAAGVLRAITRGNPADTNAPRELVRLEKAILATQLEKLAAAIEAKDDARAVSLALEIESLNFGVRPDGEVWRQGQEARCRLLLRQAQQQRSSNAWAAANSLLLLLNSLLEEHGLTWTGAEAQALREIEAWVSQCRKAAEEDRKFQRALLELRQMVAGCEASNAAALPLDRTELRAQCESLDRKRREVDQFGRSVEDEIAARAGKALLVLRGKLKRRNQSVRNRVAAALAGFAIAAVAISLFFWHERQARDFGAELKAHRETRHVAAVERFAAQVRGENAHLVHSSAPLRHELESADQFLQTERQRKERCERMLAQLQGAAIQEFTNAAPEQIQAQIEATSQAVTETAEDFQTALNASLTSVQNRWGQWLEQRRKERVTEFERRLRPAETLADSELKYARGPESVRATLTNIHPMLLDLRPLITPPLRQLRLPPDAEARFHALQTRVTTFSNEIAQWGRITAGWGQPVSLEAYLESLKTFQQSEFAPPAQKAPAVEVLGFDITISTLMAGLLLPGDPVGWAEFTRRPNSSTLPADVMPGEHTRFNQLRDDDNMKLSQCKIILLSPPAVASKTWLAYANGGLRLNKLGRKTGLIYDPAESPNAVGFKPREFDNFELRVEDRGLAEESVAFERVGMKLLIDSRTGVNYGMSLLVILDNINRESAGSPLFRAYLALRVHEIMELRPHVWDAHWAPNAALDRELLRGLGAEAIKSGDWLAPGRATNGARLEQHLTQARQVSYREQAKFLSALARRTVAAGFALAGHADAAGQPVLPTPPQDRAELWGWTRQAKAPALLFRYRAGEGRYLAVHQAMPFTPLFTFRADRIQMLNEERKSISSNPAQLGSHLPPLFSTPYE